MQKLIQQDGSGLVTILLDGLRRDEIVQVQPDGSDQFPAHQFVVVDRLGNRVYLVRFPQGGEFPELGECEPIQRIAAQQLLKLKQDSELQSPYDRGSME